MRYKPLIAQYQQVLIFVVMDINLEILGIQAIKKVFFLNCFLAYKANTAKTRIDLALIKFILYIIMSFFNLANKDVPVFVGNLDDS